MRFAVYAVYFFATAVPRAASFLLIIVMTRLLPVADYGAFALAIAIGDILDMAFGNWIRILLLREQGRVQRFGGDTAGRLSVLAILASVAGMLIGAAATRFLSVPEPAMFALVTASYVAANATSKFSLTILQLLGRSRSYGLIEGARATAILVMVPTVALLSGNFYLPALTLNAITLVGGIAGLALALRASEPISFPQRGYGTSLWLGLPIVIVALLTYGVGGIDRFFLQTFATTAVVGLYSAAYALGRQPVEVIAASVNLVGFPALVAAHAGGDRQAGEKILIDNTMLLLVLCPFIGAMFLAVGSQIADVVLPASYHATALVVTPLAVAGATMMSLKFFVFDNIFHVFKRNWYQIACMVPGAATTMIVSYALVPGLGTTGAVTGYVAGAAVALAVTIVATRPLIAVHLPWKDVCLVLGAQALSAGAAYLVAGMLAPAGSLAAGLAGGIVGVVLYGCLLLASGAAIVGPVVGMARRRLGI
jgi:O-antigen/teichoic acid export membrane protein